MTDIILPPSLNWFQHNAMSCRQSDNLIATACFKNIIIYEIMKSDNEVEAKCIKKIHHGPGKINGIALYPDQSHATYGKMIIAIGDQGSISVINIKTGEFIDQYQIKKNSLESLTWGSVDGEDVVAIVGNGGSLYVWKPSCKMNSFILSKHTLSLIDVVPQDRSQAVICCNKSILLVSLKRGEILSEMKGHTNSIYCLKWFPGTCNPTTVDVLPTNTRWNRDDEDVKKTQENDATITNGSSDSSCGPYFATSDYGRNIFLWDLSLKRYIVKTSVSSASQQSRKPHKGKGEAKQHISLTWHNDKLYSSTLFGEVISWILSPISSKHKIVVQSHQRPIYNMVTLGDVLVTSSQDRVVCGYNLQSKKIVFQVQTLGGCATTMAFCPHDAYRIALGMHEGAIRILTVGKQNKIQKSTALYQSNRDKILALAWHPCQESTLLFGTNEGKVGCIDVCSGKVNCFSYFHSKSVYKVEWAPPICPQKSGLDADGWFAYSFGDREIVLRDASNMLKDPVNINSLLQLEPSTNFSISEFAFSPDYDYVALGSIDGIVKIYNRLTATLLLNLHHAKKTVQHLSWKPPSSSDIPYILAIASAESVIYIANLDQHFGDLKKNPGEPLTITTASQELSAHTARVVWLSWSCHNDGLLASASYDRTVQIWDTNSGQPLHNYGGHGHRVFRVEFSPLHSDLVLSFSEENCLLQWQPSKITERTPRDSAATVKTAKPRRAIQKSSPERKRIETDSMTSSVSSGSNDIIQSSGAGLTYKKAPKSLFPLLHSVSNKKKAFLQLCILSLVEFKKSQEEFNLKIKEDHHSLDDLDDDSCDNITDGETKDKVPTLENIAESTLKKYKSFVSNNMTEPKADEMCEFLDFFGNVSDIDKVVSQEILNHDSHENFTNANILHCWKGSLESRIKFAINHNLLDSFLVSLAPQVSFSLWESACQAYADQLLNSNQPVLAATYLLAIRKEEEAVDLLIKAKHFREALTVAKYRLGFNKEIVEKVVNAWISIAILEGNFELACALQVSVGNFDQGARLMSRRSEPGSLIVAAKLYELAQNTELAQSTAVIAIKESSLKHDYAKVETLINQIPYLKWYKTVNICHQLLLTFAQNVISEPALEPYPNTFSDGKSLLKQIVTSWSGEGIETSNSEECYTNLKVHFSTVKMPNTLKQFWFFLSASITELILLGLSKSYEESCLENEFSNLLKYVEFWDKPRQTYLITHALLPEGSSDFATIEEVFGNLNTSLKQRLTNQYILSEVTLIATNLETSQEYVPWTTSSVELLEQEENKDSTINGTLNPDCSDDPGSAKLDGTSSAEPGSAKLDGTSSAEPGSAKLDGTSSETCDIEIEQIASKTSKISLNSKSPSLVIFSNENDFAIKFKRYVSDWNSTLEEPKVESEGIKKLMSQIIISLCERSAINEATFRDLLNVVNGIH